MNILSIEDKFKALDEKEKKVRMYYNPKSTKGKKHHYISDIRADFHYDTLLYGLGMFWMQETEEDIIDEIKQEQEPIINLPIPESIQPKSPVLAKRRNLALLELQKPLSKDHYKGIFSHTKVLNHDYLYKKPYVDFGKSGWKTAAINERGVKNKAAKAEIIYSSRVQDCTQTLSQKINRFRVDSPQKSKKRSELHLNAEEFKKYLEESKQLVFNGKEPAKFDLSLESLRKKPQGFKDKNIAPQLFHILFQSSTIIQVKTINALVSVCITNVSISGFPNKNYVGLSVDNGYVMWGNNNSLDLRQIFGEGIDKNTIRVLIQGDKENVDYYVRIQEFKEGDDIEVKDEIIAYKLVIFEKIKANSNKPLVVPITLHKINEKLIPKNIQPNLPKIDTRSKPTLNNKKKNFANPLTSALFSYKVAAESFHPQAYPANLSIFEAHDFIEENYSLPPKPKPPSARAQINLAVSGFGLNNSYIS
ncbi:hypothetical protein SteCoe_12605 [Stentor coeruleus]|uniref:Uncharacterized protein n=1 Tax=Stentor coeruleus TaxID=5963 RepID=A0A1R2CAE6_9CILI|nr:hypothetical protein SteCoe_12605 [Stentor coeruleus]